MVLHGANGKPNGQHSAQHSPTTVSLFLAFCIATFISGVSATSEMCRCRRGLKRCRWRFDKFGIKAMLLVVPDGAVAGATVGLAPCA